MKKYFEHKILEKLSKIPFKSKIISKNINKGFHKSRMKGKNMEFKEHREYSYGDELRDIDWKVYGKTEKYFVKDYEEDIINNVLIMLDTSSSMVDSFAGKTPKIEYAKHITAALTYLFINQRDIVSVVGFDTSSNIILSPSNKKISFDILSDKFNRLSRNNTKTDFSLLRKTKEIYKNMPFLGIIISDLIAPRESIIKAIASFDLDKNEISVIHLIHQLEDYFNMDGYIEFVDPESGRVINIKAVDVKEKFNNMYHKHINELRRELVKRNIDYNKFIMAKHYSDNLIEYMKKHNK